MTDQVENPEEVPQNSEKALNLIKLGRTYIGTDLSEARKQVMKAISIAKQNNDHLNICRAYNLIADIYRRKGKFDKTIKYCQKSIGISQTTGNKRSEAASNLLLGVTSWNKGEFEKANPYLETALKIYDELEDQDGKAGAYNNMSLVHWEMGKLQKALEYQELCLEIEKQLDNSQAVATSYLNFGLIYEDIGDWEKSIECFFRALVEKERIQDKAGIVLCYNNIGEIYLKKRRIEKALKFFKEAIRLADETGSLQNKAEVFGNIGYVHFLTGDLVTAINYYNENLDISLKIGDKEELAEVYRRMAELLILTKPQMCYSSLNKALRFASTAGSRKELGNVMRVFGKFNAKMENHTEADNSFIKSIEILKPLSKNYELAETYRDYGKFLIENGKKQEGINHLRESSRIFDRLDITTEVETIESFLIQLEGEKEKMLSLLKKVGSLSGRVSSLKEFMTNCLNLFFEILNFQNGIFYVFGHKPSVIGNINPDEALQLCKRAEIQITPKNILIPLQAGNENIGFLNFGWQKETVFSNDLTYWEITANVISLELEKMKILSEIEGQKIKGFVFKGVAGETDAMKEIFDTIERTAPTNACVLIRGESGTGKELIAKTIHEMSNRVTKPFITINCSAIPETLLESELFGVEKGTATGVEGRKGKLEQANNGTVFLDEIGDMSFSLQAKILRVLQEKTFERVGGRNSINVDIRFIAATNKDLQKEIKNGNFRNDLYHRLNVIQIFLPPLRDRKQDIPLFVEYFIEKFAKEFCKPVKSVSREVLQSFAAYSWPGNIREMENTLERALILSKNNQISLLDLPPQFEQTFKTQENPADISTNLIEVKRIAKKDNLATIEKDFILKALAEHKNVLKAARALGISRGHLYYLMKNNHIKRRKYERKT